MSIPLWRCGDLVSFKYSHLYIFFVFFWTLLTSQHKAHLARRNLHWVNAENLGCNSACLPHPLANVSTRMSWRIECACVLLCPRSTILYLLERGMKHVVNNALPGVNNFIFVKNYAQYFFLIKCHLTISHKTYHNSLYYWMYICLCTF